MKNTHEIRETINTLAETMAQVASILGIDSDLVFVTKFEIASFMMYLSSSDGEISWEEARLISDLCDLNLNTPQKLTNFIKEQNIYSTEFETTVPTCFQMLILGDNLMIQKGKLIEADALEAMLNTYRTVGQLLMEIDDNVDIGEETDFHIYISMLEEYLSANALRYQNVSLGIEKNTGSVSAPAKSGKVAAPKKG